MWCFATRCKQLYLYYLYFSWTMPALHTHATVASVCVLKYLWWTIISLCLILPTAMWNVISKSLCGNVTSRACWTCRCSGRACVRACIAACYRTVVYSLSLCVIWCSWLSSNLIWEHLIPRCLFPLCLISVLHKQSGAQAKSKASIPRCN